LREFGAALGLSPSALAPREGVGGDAAGAALAEAAPRL
jgi:hypothetical protein